LNDKNLGTLHFCFGKQDRSFTHKSPFRHIFLPLM
jgi:hypothetical protein